MSDTARFRPITNDEQPPKHSNSEAVARPVSSSPRRRRAVRSGLIALVVVVGALLIGRWLLYRTSHVYTVDSRIAAREVTVSSAVDGRVIAMQVLAGDKVAAGDLLVGIESRQSRLELQRINSEITRIEAEMSRLAAQQAMIGEQVASRLQAGQAALAAAEANHRASQAVLDNVQSHYERTESMYGRGLISSELFEDAGQQLVNAEQQELRAMAGIKTARAELAVTRSGKAQIAVLDRQIAALEAGKSAQVARMKQQRIDLDRRRVSAAFDGVIDQIFVDTGEYVSPGRRLLMYHDPANIWVAANFKETEFRRLQVGAPATITVDAYPDREFHGEVLRLGQAATSQFALLPSPNPSGNFTKVTQRLPVRISLDQVSGLLRPGMMVEVTVDVLD